MNRVAVVLLCLACPAAGADVLYKWIGLNGVVEFSDKPRIEQDPLNEERLRAEDADVQRASAQIDLAESALAAARRPVWTRPAPGQLTAARMTRADSEQIESCKRNFVVARQMLLEVLQQKRRAGAPTLTASVDSAGVAR